MNYELKNITGYNVSFSLLFSLLILFLAFPVFASTTDGTIVTGGNAGFAWSNNIGWVNFGIANGNMHVTDAGITGNVWSILRGWINLAPTNGGVAVAASGALSGYVWGSSLGWINFSGVSINSSGKFIGQATGAVIGTLTFDCDNCNVTTDYRPQNFRTIVTLPSVPSVTVSSGGGGNGMPFVSVPGGQAVPAHINAFNVPMKLFPVQSGTLTQNLTNQKSVILDAPNNVYSDDITFLIREETISPIISVAVSVIGNALFSVTAWDKANNPVRSFSKPIKITLNIPELLRGRSDLGVYYFDDTTKVWVKISDAVFSSDSVSFYVNHLTLFAIFGATELPPAIKSPFPLPRVEIQPPQEKTLVPEFTPALQAGGSKEAPPLFDIEVSPGPAASKKNITYYIIAAIGIIAAGIVIYILRRRKMNQRTYEI